MNHSISQDNFKTGLHSTATVRTSDCETNINVKLTYEVHIGLSNLKKKRLNIRQKVNIEWTQWHQQAAVTSSADV